MCALLQSASVRVRSWDHPLSIHAISHDVAGAPADFEDTSDAVHGGTDDVPADLASESASLAARAGEARAPVPKERPGPDSTRERSLIFTTRAFTRGLLDDNRADRGGQTNGDSMRCTTSSRPTRQPC